MLRSLIFSTALVASSAAGAVALSALHESTFEAGTSRFAAPEPVASSFVIPAYAQTQTAPVANETALPAVVIEASAPLAKIETEDLFLTPVSTGNGHGSVQEPDASEAAPVIARPLPATVARPAAAPRAVVEQVQAPQINAPVIVEQVAQTPAAPVVRQTAVVPSYTIGVYR